MLLGEFLEQRNLSPERFATRIGVSRVSVDRYVRQERIPEPPTMRRIFEVTNGAVTPSDFYNLPVRPKRNGKNRKAG